MSIGSRPSVPCINGIGCPSRIPTLTPFAPGKVPNRLSNVRFSLIRKTTCLIGNFVSRECASNAAGAWVGPLEEVGPLGGVAPDADAVEPVAGAVEPVDPVEPVWRSAPADVQATAINASPRMEVAQRRARGRIVAARTLSTAPAN